MEWILPSTNYTIHHHEARFMENANHLVIPPYDGHYYVRKTNLGRLLWAVWAHAKYAWIVDHSYNSSPRVMVLRNFHKWIIRIQLTPNTTDRNVSLSKQEGHKA